MIDEDIKDQVKHFKNVQGIKAKNKATYHVMIDDCEVFIKAEINIKQG